MKILNFKSTHAVLLLFTLTYILCATSNANIDSWYYAACVKHGYELLNSHHLFYNAFGHFIFSILKVPFPGIEAIATLNFINALAAGISIFVLYRIFQLSGKDKFSALILSLFCASGFGFMRYASDAETYILPLMFSLTATLYYLSENKTKGYILAGVFAAISVLFHQLHIWWTLSLFFVLFLKRPLNVRHILCFGIPLLIIPAAYLFAWRFSDTQNLQSFIIGEYATGNASVIISAKGTVLTLINLFRSVLQVHGNLYFLFLSKPLFFSATVVLCLTLIFIPYKKRTRGSITLQSVNLRLDSIAILLAFFSHLIFAWLSSGNAEFMVMLPALAAIFVSLRYKFNLKPLSLLPVLAIFIWNLNTGILPAAFLNISRCDSQVRLSRSDTSSVYLWQQKALVENKLCYDYGFVARPELLKPEHTDSFMIREYLNSGRKIYTDLGNMETKYSRSGILNGQNSFIFPKDIEMTAVDSFDNIYGKNYIYRLQALK